MEIGLLSSSLVREGRIPMGVTYITEVLSLNGQFAYRAPLHQGVPHTGMKGFNKPEFLNCFCLLGSFLFKSHLSGFVSLRWE